MLLQISIDTDEHSIGGEVLRAKRPPNAESAFTSDVCSWLAADRRWDWVVSGIVECI